MTAPGHASVLFVCERPEPDPVLCRIAEDLGETVVHARSAAAGIEQARHQDYALMLVGYAGDEAAVAATIRQLRATRRSVHTPVVAIGVPAQAPFPVEPLFEAGAIAVLTEPLSPVILRAKLRFYIDAFQATAERRRAEAALIDASARLESVIAAAELGVWSWDIVADRVTGDARIAALFGIPAVLGEGAPVARCFESVHPDDLAAMQALLAEAVERGGSYDATFRVRRPEGGG